MNIYQHLISFQRTERLNNYQMNRLGIFKQNKMTLFHTKKINVPKSASMFSGSFEKAFTFNSMISMCIGSGLTFGGLFIYQKFFKEDKHMEDDSDLEK